MGGTFTVGRDVYHFSEIDSEIGGRAFEVTRVGGASYHVRLSPDECECLGYLRHGHCRHINGLRGSFGRRAAHHAPQEVNDL